MARPTSDYRTARKKAGVKVRVSSDRSYNWVHRPGRRAFTQQLIKVGRNLGLVPVWCRPRGVDLTKFLR